MPVVPYALAGVALFALAAWFTRAGPRRIAAALIGGLLAAGLNIGWDLAAHAQGWWRYVGTDAALPPLTMYAPVALAFGGAAGLIGWRCVRAWGGAGLAAFLVAYVALGVARDGVYAARGDVFVFGAGLAPRLADAAGWLSLALVVQVALRLLAGPAGADRLRGARP